MKFTKVSQNTGCSTCAADFNLLNVQLVRQTVFILLLFVPFCWVTAVYGAEVVGSIKSVEGAASVSREGEDLGPTVGLKLLETDILATGAGGSLSVVLRDDTLISIGPNSRASLSEFVFKPRDNELSMLIEVFKGVAAFVSGEIAKLSPESVTIKTPDGTIGIRGTRFAVRVYESPL